jgi:hypothetical protein
MIAMSRAFLLFLVYSKPLPVVVRFRSLRAPCHGENMCWTLGADGLRLLGLGGGIQGAIQFLRVDALTNSSTSGGCASEPPLFSRTVAPSISVHRALELNSY